MKSYYIYYDRISYYKYHMQENSKNNNESSVRAMATFILLRVSIPICIRINVIITACVQLNCVKD